MLRPVLACSVLFCLIVSSGKLVGQTQPAASAAAAAAAPATPQSSTKVGAVPLPDPETPQEFFARARALSELVASGIPFHLKATYVATGDTEFTGTGTYEEWWQSKEMWRKEATLGDFKYVEIRNGGKPAVYASSGYVPLRLRQVLSNVMVAIAPDAGTASEWKLKHKKVNGVDLVVLTIARPCGMVKSKMKCLAEDYFSTQGVLRIDVKGSVDVIYNNFQEFQRLEVPRTIQLAEAKVNVLTISIASLEPLSASEGVWLQSAASPANLPPIRRPLVADRKELDSVQVSKGKITNMTQPEYPLAAKQQYLQGIVVMKVTIDEAGNVREPFVTQSAGTLLDRAAVEAVRKWRYETTTLNGAPVCVNSTISVVFGLNH
jgi:TonB family protein